MSNIFRLFLLIPATILGFMSVASAAPDAETAYIFNSFSFLVHGFLVMLMAAGFCMLETGLVRAKNAVVQCAKNIGLYSIAGIMFAVVGYNLMYMDVSGFMGSFAIWGPGDGETFGGENDATYSSGSDWWFQMVFCATAASIVSGAVAERVKLKAFLIFVVVLCGFIYPIQGSWSWGGGYLSEAGFLDFAGSSIVHGVGGLLVADGVSFAPHATIDIQELNCDVYLYSTYKTYGPHIGLMYTSENVSEQVTNQGHFFNSEKPTYRLTPAGPDHASVAACAGMIDYYEEIYEHHFGNDTSGLRDRIIKVFDLFGEHEEQLMTPLINYILSREDFRLIGSHSTSRDERAPTIAFHSQTATSEAIYDALINSYISCGHGNFYAHRLTEAIGLNPEDGVVRLSMVHYNTLDEVERAIEVLESIG